MAEAENIMVWQRQRLAEAEVKKPHVSLLRSLFLVQEIYFLCMKQLRFSAVRQLYQVKFN